MWQEGSWHQGVASSEHAVPGQQQSQPAGVTTCRDAARVQTPHAQRRQQPQAQQSSNLWECKAVVTLYQFNNLYIPAIAIPATFATRHGLIGLALALGIPGGAPN